MNVNLDHERTALERLAAGKKFADDVRVLRMALDRLAALSTPPADDVREALARIVEDNFEAEDEPHRTADAILAAFEVRPHGTFTPSFDAWRALIERVQADWPNVRVPGTTWQMTPQQAEASDRAQARRCAELAEADSRFRATLTGYLDLRTVARVMADLEAAREVRSDV